MNPLKGLYPKVCVTVSKAEIQAYYGHIRPHKLAEKALMELTKVLSDLIRPLQCPVLHPIASA